MEFLQIAVLAVVQGLTEFLPISSSAHLILAPVLFGWEDQGLAFDVATHMGSLAAILLYFRKDLVCVAQDTWRSVWQRQWVGSGALGVGVVLGTIPVGLAGLLFKDVIETSLRSPLVIAWTTIGFALLMVVAERWGKRSRPISSLNWRDALAIGVAQAIALIPGTSRSGITMTAGLALGFTRQAAARFSFLLAIPVTVLAGGLSTFDLIAEPTAHAHWGALALGAALSGLAAYACIAVFLRLIDRIGFMPFVIYRLILGLFLLWIFSA